MSEHYKETKCGFEWGAANVSRCCSDAKKGRVILSVQTAKNTIEVYITKTGKIRVFSPKGELKP